jgi:hypothetical protein
MSARRSIPGSMLKLAVLSIVLAMPACSLPLFLGLNRYDSPSKLPIIGGNSNLHTDAVASIRTLAENRIAVMPILETPDKIDNVVAEGAGEAISAELYSEMSLVGGWEVAPDGDVEQAMAKLPPSTPGNLQDNALALGRAVSVDGVIYGTVEQYKERVGVAYAAASPAAVTFTLHLIDIKSKEVVWTAKFSKSQKALSENMLNLVNFLQNSGRWVRAHEIANEGVHAAVANLRSEIALNQNVKHFETGSYEEMKEMSHRYKGGPE